MDLVCGPNAVFEALRGERPVVRLLVARETGPGAGKTARVLEEARRQGIPVRRVTRQELDRLATARHQGLVAVVGAFRPGRDPEEALDAMAGVPLVVVLDGIEDPRNLGAVIRSCECAGVGAVFVPRRRSAPFSEVAVTCRRRCPGTPAGGGGSQHPRTAAAAGQAGDLVGGA